MNRQTLVGSSAAMSVVFVWSGWIVVSRFGVLNNMTVFDIAGLRFGIGALIAAPWVWRKKPWRELNRLQIGVLFLCCGPIYALLTYFGFIFAPAAHGGVFINGCLPILTAGVAWIWLKERRTRIQIIGLGITLFGVVLVGWDGLTGPSGDLTWVGDILFLSAVLLFSVYVTANRRWGVTPVQVVFCVTVLGALVYIPIWLLWLDSNLAAAPWRDLLLQGAYQGIVPSLAGISFLSIAVKNIGPNSTSVFLACVPVVGALLAVPTLGEIPGLSAWLGMALVIGGVVLSLGLVKPASPPEAPWPAEDNRP